jgi:hypothetical protein
MKKEIFYAAIILLTTAVSCKNNPSKTTDVSVKKETITEQAKGTSAYKYDDLYAQYQKDYFPGEGNKKMDGTQIILQDKITGVTEVEEPDGKKSIQVGFGRQTASEFSDYKIVANFTGALAEKAKTLKTGDAISIDGKIKNGEFRIITLENCAIKL